MLRNRRTSVVIALLLIFILLLVACSDAQSTPDGDTTQPQATEVVEDEHMEEEGEDHDEAEADHDEEGEEHDHDDTDADHDEEGETHDHDDTEAEHDDHEHVHVDAPHEYEDLVNPVSGDSEAIAAGEALFLSSCATCHGETGMGDGEAAAGLDPKPAPLANAGMLADLTDGYLYWRIEQGGARDPFNSAMPAWGEAFSEDQIWQLVSFIRTLPAE